MKETLDQLKEEVLKGVKEKGAKNLKLFAPARHVKTAVPFKEGRSAEFRDFTYLPEQQKEALRKSHKVSYDIGILHVAFKNGKVVEEYTHFVPRWYGYSNNIDEVHTTCDALVSCEWGVLYDDAADWTNTFLLAARVFTGEGELVAIHTIAYEPISADSRYKREWLNGKEFDCFTDLLELMAPSEEAKKTK